MKSRLGRFFPVSNPAQRLTIKSKLQAMFLTISLGSVLVVGWIIWVQGRAIQRDNITTHLTTLRLSWAGQYEIFFEGLYDQLRLLAQDQGVI